MNDAKHPFFRPLWRRVAVVAVCLIWSAIEWWNGQTLWGAITLAIAAWGIWVFFITFDENAAEAPPPSRDGKR